MLETTVLKKSKRTSHFKFLDHHSKEELESWTYVKNIENQLPVMMITVNVVAGTFDLGPSRAWPLHRGLPRSWHRGRLVWSGGRLGGDCCNVGLGSCCFLPKYDILIWDEMAMERDEMRWNVVVWYRCVSFLTCFSRAITSIPVPLPFCGQIQRRWNLHSVPGGEVMEIYFTLMDGSHKQHQWCGIWFWWINTYQDQAQQTFGR